MSRDDDPKLILDEHEWRCYKRATRNLRYKQRLQNGKFTEMQQYFAPWLQAVEWDDDGDPVLDIAETVFVLPVELVA